MPTTRPRHVLTETDELATALDDASQRWPADASDKRRLLLHLIEEGHKAIDPVVRANHENRKRAILQTSGDLPGVYEPGYLDRLRDDWPA